MEFIIKSTRPEKLKTGTLAVLAFADVAPDGAAAALDQASEGRLARMIERGELDQRAGATLLVPELPGSAARRVLVASLGKRAEFTEKAWRDAIAAVAKVLANSPTDQAALCIELCGLPGRELEWLLQQATRMIADGAYRFDTTKSRKNGELAKGASKLTLLTSDKPSAAMKQALTQGAAIAEGMALARELGNLPGNICTPSHLADTARALGKQHQFEVEVLEREAMEKLGMGSLLSVAKGSAQPPKFIVMHYHGGKARQAPIVLVGKGITFDTGGISLKPAAEMDEMKFDMCGAAGVLGTFKTLATLRLPINVVGLIPTTENMPGGHASKPGDVVTSMSGQTIEVLNTDAEGRLILCDALTYAERFKPDCVIDLATLTGACVIALGKIPSGLLANDDSLARELLDCGQWSGDRAWQLPLWDDYQELLKSNFADMANIGGRYAGTITAACFLSRFAKAYKWAHLDIAGTAWVSGDAKGATGRPVPLLSEFLLRRSAG